MPNLTGFERKLTVGSGDVELAAHLVIPGKAAGAVVVADAGESGRRHPWACLAAALNQAGLGTLVVGLLTPQEMLSYGNRFSLRALAGRLADVTRWLLRHPAARGFPVGYFGAAAGAAAALWAVTAEPRIPVAAIACQDGRPAGAAGRLILVAGAGVGMLVAAFPQPADGGSLLHAIWASAGFCALADWPAAAWRRGPGVPWALMPAVCAIAAAMLVLLLAWFAAEVVTGGGHAGWPNGSSAWPRRYGR